jgi:hypothetical protein
MSDNPEQIRTAVRQHYAQHALNSSSCCGDSGCDNTFYSTDL